MLLENTLFSEPLGMGVLDREDMGSFLMTEVAVANLALAGFAAIPGEAFPDFGLELWMMKPSTGSYWASPRTGWAT
ncbi:MAG: hypothetical protein JTT11_05290 [Candidatus Brockarchaeota archaeon]|nr:hypothetical protein [Candidatus Brockarchaeota archaeon]